ncbi:aminoglycoside phosphotransferase family protein [Couchioplanes caeruleus]|uniref:aminoglycoside phosphotransferase family protein n=1 Tax=Couchioplanes caeruleus TaxID=56438 RepID=UPI0020BF3543|nr:aminoglycoside phosphotransferase family protein [Couchioplanes caeruleus]UQU66649.1 aminoglycoside phosphotransferase family protein [Couchioplanes caeruleus]
MRSPTQRRLDLRTIDEMLSPALGTPVVQAAELSGGGFAAVWRATLADGRSVVVKAGPPDDARLLRYERDLIPAEARYFRMVRDIAPVPEVLHLGDGWIATTLLPGRSLTDVPDAASVREELGRVIARVHTVEGTRFGYDGDRPSGRDWPEAFTAIMRALIADAADWDVPLPAGILEAVERHRAALASVTRPALLHFDLWDGNVLTEQGRLTGLVDGERYLYGDPLLDLVSPALFHRIEDEPDHPFLRGYAAATGLVLDDEARTRLTLYRLHLYTLMVTECPSRGVPVGHERHARMSKMLADELARL